MTINEQFLTGIGLDHHQPESLAVRKQKNNNKKNRIIQDIRIRSTPPKKMYQEPIRPVQVNIFQSNTYIHKDFSCFQTDNICVMIEVQVQN